MCYSKAAYLYIFKITYGAMIALAGLCVSVALESQLSRQEFSWEAAIVWKLAVIHTLHKLGNFLEHHYKVLANEGLQTTKRAENITLG